MLGGVAKAIDQGTGDEDFNELLYDLAVLPPAEIPYGAEHEHGTTISAGGTIRW